MKPAGTLDPKLGVNLQFDTSGSAAFPQLLKQRVIDQVAIPRKEQRRTVVIIRRDLKLADQLNPLWEFDGVDCEHGHDVYFEAVNVHFIDTTHGKALQGLWKTALKGFGEWDINSDRVVQGMVDILQVTEPS
jgi:hypothetical protein